MMSRVKGPALFVFFFSWQGIEMCRLEVLRGMSRAHLCLFSFFLAWGRGGGGGGLCVWTVARGLCTTDV